MLSIALAIAAAGALGFVVLGFALGELQHSLKESALPVIRAAPDYVLTNQLGEPVSSSNFRGKVQLVTFLDPYCTHICPLLAAHLINFERLAARPAGIENKVQIVAFNLDPNHAGPLQMRAFLKEYGWNPQDLHWQYLTGSAAAVRRVVRDGFAVAYEAVPLSSEAGGSEPGIVEPEVVNKLAQQAHRNYDIAHSDIIEVVDQEGRVRKIYAEADTVGSTELLKVVQSLLGRAR